MAHSSRPVGPIIAGGPSSSFEPSEPQRRATNVEVRVSRAVGRGVVRGDSRHRCVQRPSRSDHQSQHCSTPARGCWPRTSPHAIWVASNPGHYRCRAAGVSRQTFKAKLTQHQTGLVSCTGADRGEGPGQSGVALRGSRATGRIIKTDALDGVVWHFEDDYHQVSTCYRSQATASARWDNHRRCQGAQ